MRITNTGEQVTDLDLSDAALDQVASEQGHTAQTSDTVTPTSPSGTLESEPQRDERSEAQPVQPNGDDDEGDVTDDDTTPQSGDNITGDMVAAEKKRYLAAVRKIGMQDGLGKKAILVFAETVVEGAMSNNAIVPEDAKRFYDDFQSASAKKAVMDDGILPTAAKEVNEKSYEKQLDKLRALIRLGNDFTDEATSDDQLPRKATDIVRRARNLHIKLMDSPAEKKLLKLTSTYEAIVAVARQQRSDTYKSAAMTEEEMRAVLQGEEKKPKTGADYLIAALDAIAQAKKGKPAKDDEPGRERIDHASLNRAETNLHEVLGDIDPDLLDKYLKKHAKAAEKAATAAFSYGYSRQ